MLAQLAREERVRASVRTVLPHLVAADDAAPLGEELVIRTRALLAALADDLQRDQPDAARHKLGPRLAEALAARPALLAHCHALAMEGEATERLGGAGVDPMLAPLVEILLAPDPDTAPDTAALAMTTLAAQTRFVCAQRRLSGEAGELPSGLLHMALVALADLPEGPGDAGVAAWQARYAEGRTRLSLLARLTLAASDHAESLLDPARAGFALFCTALAERAGVPREEVVLAAAPGQGLRLALLLRTAGAAPDVMRSAMALIHPGAALPGEWLDLPGHRAAALLAGAGA